MKLAIILFFFLSFGCSHESKSSAKQTTHQDVLLSLNVVLKNYHGTLRRALDISKQHDIGLSVQIQNNQFSGSYLKIFLSENRTPKVYRCPLKKSERVFENDEGEKAFALIYRAELTAPLCRGVLDFIKPPRAFLQHYYFPKNRTRFTNSKGQDAEPADFQFNKSGDLLSIKGYNTALGYEFIDFIP